MKNPESKSTRKSTTKSEAADGALNGAAEKKAAASASVVDSSPVNPGEAGAAAATGGEIKPADSALLSGDEAAGAAKKPDSAPVPLASPTAAKPSGDKPADQPVAKANGTEATWHEPTPADPVTTVRPELPKSEPVKSEAGKPEPAKPAPVQPPRKSGFLPMALGGAVAAGLGAAAVLGFLPNGWKPAPTLDTAALKQDIMAEVQSGNAALRDEVVAAVSGQAGEAGAEAARQIIAAMPEGEATTPELRAALAAQGQQIAALTERVSAIGAGGAGADIGEIQAQLSAMQAQLEETAGEAQSRLDAVLADAEKLQEAAADSTQRAEAVAAIASLQTALDEGDETQPAVQQLQDAGIAPPEAVQQEVPTLLMLQDGFAEAARAGLRAALRDSSAEADGGTLIGNFLRVQTGARSVEPREGTDPDAVLSRAGAAVETGDIATALTEMEALPAVAREAPEMAEWLTGAQALAAARAALDDLSGQADSGQTN